MEENKITIVECDNKLNDLYNEITKIQKIKENIILDGLNFTGKFIKYCHRDNLIWLDTEDEGCTYHDEMDKQLSVYNYAYIYEQSAYFNELVVYLKSIMFNFSESPYLDGSYVQVDSMYDIKLSFKDIDDYKLKNKNSNYIIEEISEEDFLNAYNSMLSKSKRLMKDMLAKAKEFAK